MIDKKRVIALISARAGSKAVADKNIHDLCGKPLLVWAIDVAKKTPEIDRIIVSTDGEKIAKIANDCEVEVDVRPEHLSTDTALIIDAIREIKPRLHEKGEMAEYMVLLEPTSPFRTSHDISTCLKRIEDEGLDSIATFCEASTNPHRAWKIENDLPEVFIEGAVPWAPRQTLPKAYELTGAVYAFNLQKLDENCSSILFGKMGAHIIPKERSIDIDEEIDFVIADAILKSR